MSDPLSFFGARQILKVGGQEYIYYALEHLGKTLELDYDIRRLPVSLKILLEGLLRHEGRGVTVEQIRKFVAWGMERQSPLEVSFFPARILMQDFTGVPALVDLAGMRDALEKWGGDAEQVNPQIPVDLVIDHSVIVDSFGSEASLAQNIAGEFERNRERYQFLKWGQKAFQNLRVVPPGRGICHQVNLEYLAPGLVVTSENILFPDTVIGTDSHTTMINGLGVLGWGVGGIEAEAVMLGQPLSLVVSKVVGVRLKGVLPEGVLATDVVLTLTSLLREQGVVNCFVEFFGEGLKSLTLPDRATLANMAPEFGATCAFFPIDEHTLDYLRLTGRPPERINLLEAYAKKQGLWVSSEELFFSHILDFDLSQIVPTMAGPKRPQDRVPLSVVAAGSIVGAAGGEDQSAPVHAGDVVIAAITSCTNTSNPSAMIAAGLLAEKAVAAGLTVKPWVKTSLAPGSQVVTQYLEKLGLQSFLDQFGFYLVGFGCTTCIGNSGPLLQEVADYVQQNDLEVAAVLSGNRNFEGRIHPQVKLNYLASPPLVVAYALAGNLKVNLLKNPLGVNSQGLPVFLRDIWPTNQEIQAMVERAVTADLFKASYKEIFEGSSEWQDLPVAAGALYNWDAKSTYIRKSPYFDGVTAEKSPLVDIEDARILAIFGDSITTDHISPAGAILSQSISGQYLQSLGVPPAALNSYGARRGNHEVMVRGTFANPRLHNEMASDQNGGMTLYAPTEKIMSIFDAAQLYKKQGTSLVIFAGKEYGTGSSRDWAAKGTSLLGVRAVVAESFERIHRSNLVGMGVLPLQFREGITRHDLKLTGLETVDVLELFSDLGIGATVTLRIRRNEENFLLFPVKCCLATEDEVAFFRDGGILPAMLRRMHSI